METIPGKTKCKYLEDTEPESLANQITVFLQDHTVIDISYQQHDDRFGAYLIYITDEPYVTTAKAVEYEMEINSY